MGEGDGRGPLRRRVKTGLKVRQYAEAKMHQQERQEGAPARGLLVSLSQAPAVLVLQPLPNRGAAIASATKSLLI
jgi:hypothetical protein